MTKLVAIAAMGKERTIGNQGGLPWSYPKELNHYKETIDNKPVIAGRKTVMRNDKLQVHTSEEVILLTSKTREELNIDTERVEIARSIKEAINIAKTLEKDVYVIGGGEVYTQMYPYYTHMILTHINESYTGDTYFPQIIKTNWEVYNVEKYGNFQIKWYKRL